MCFLKDYNIISLKLNRFRNQLEKLEEQLIKTFFFMKEKF